ncbi:MAG: YcxB family protein [Oscillospiraceae bacterium]|jgi:hypothetical protein|nr:YcxB family protein [Oscillospiraceae bacterium]
MPDQPTLFSVTVGVNKQDFVAFTRCKLVHLQHLLILSFLPCIGVALMTLAGLFADDTDPEMSAETDLIFLISMIVVAVLFTGVMFAALWWLTPHTTFMAIQKRFCVRQDFAFQETFLTVNGSRPGYYQTQTLDYGLFLKVIETPKAVFFFVDQTGIDGLILPKAGLNSEQIEWLHGFFAHKQDLPYKRYGKK